MLQAWLIFHTTVLSVLAFRHQPTNLKSIVKGFCAHLGEGNGSHGIKQIAIPYLYEYPIHLIDKEECGDVGDRTAYAKGLLERFGFFQVGEDEAELGENEVELFGGIKQGEGFLRGNRGASDSDDHLDGDLGNWDEPWPAFLKPGKSDQTALVDEPTLVDEPRPVFQYKSQDVPSYLPHAEAQHQDQAMPSQQTQPYITKQSPKLLTDDSTPSLITLSTYTKSDIEAIRSKFVVGRSRIHWFPRYFGKSFALMSDYIAMSDVILEVRDARLPLVAHDDYLLNVFNNMYTHKPRIIVFTHADLASIKGTSDWGHYYRRKEFWNCKEFNRNIRIESEVRPCTKVVFVDARRGKGIITLKKLIWEVTSRVQEKQKRKGLDCRPIRAIVLGFPNVGKSALGNRLLGRRKCSSYKSPGVTKSFNICRLHPSEYEEPVHKIIDVIDTPGLLPPNLYLEARPESSKKRVNKKICQLYIEPPKDVGYYDRLARRRLDLERNIWLLAAANNIVQGAYDATEACEALLKQIVEVYRRKPSYIPMALMCKRYHMGNLVMEGSSVEMGYRILENFSWHSYAGNQDKAATRILNDFKAGRLVGITLQVPPEAKETLRAR